MPLYIAPKKVFRGLLAAALGLTLLNLAGQWLKFFVLAPDSSRAALRLVELFDLNGEGNIPAWWAASTLLGCASLLAVTAAAKRRERDPWARHWGWLSLVLLLLSMDETIQVHEKVGLFLQGRLGTEGALRFAWVIPALILVALVGALLVRFLGHLPAATRRQWVLAGVLFVGGAVGMEVLEGRVYETAGWDSPLMALLTTVEELCEMLGVAVFAHSLLAYLGEHVPEMRVRFAQDDAAQPLIGPDVAGAAAPDGVGQTPAGALGGRAFDRRAENAAARRSR